MEIIYIRYGFNKKGLFEWEYENKFIGKSPTYYNRDNLKNRLAVVPRALDFNGWLDMFVSAKHMPSYSINFKRNFEYIMKLNWLVGWLAQKARRLNRC